MEGLGSIRVRRGYTKVISGPCRPLRALRDSTTPAPPEQTHAPPTHFPRTPGDLLPPNHAPWVPGAALEHQPMRNLPVAKPRPPVLASGLSTLAPPPDDNHAPDISQCPGLSTFKTLSHRTTPTLLCIKPPYKSVPSALCIVPPPCTYHAPTPSPILYQDEKSSPLHSLTLLASTLNLYKAAPYTDHAPTSPADQPACLICISPPYWPDPSVYFA